MAEKNATTPTPKWTEIEHLPMWDEEFYLVYTAKKFDKWVMLKTLRPEFKDSPEHQLMIEREFDLRYNLSHPNIVMINDFEDVPGVGRAIITDDVYGQSLRTILDQGKLDDNMYRQLLTRLPAALEYIQQNHIAHHRVTPDTIIFTDKIANLKLIDVGFEQKKSLSHVTTDDDVFAYGMILTEVLEKTGRRDSLARRVAANCINPDKSKRFHDMQGVQLMLNGFSSARIYMLLACFLAVITVILALLLIFTK